MSQNVVNDEVNDAGTTGMVETNVVDGCHHPLVGPRLSPFLLKNTMERLM
jgi:hypothetical protein